jgi:hypothetical protein
MDHEQKIARLLRLRDRVIWVSAIGFLVWQGGWLATDLVTAGLPMMIARFASAAGGVLWAAATLALFLYYRQVKKARAGAELNDELARYRQDRAFLAGYWILLAALAGLLGLEGFVAIDPGVLLRTLVILAVVAPLTVFLWLDRDGEAAS